MCSLGQIKISIHNINLRDNNNAQDYARRIENIAHMVLTTASSYGLSWDLIGLNECFAKRVGNYNVHYEEQDIPCCDNITDPTGPQAVITTHDMNSTHCFDTHLRDSNSPVDLTLQEGEIGFIVRQRQGGEAKPLSFVTIESRHRLLGHKWLNTIRREVVGGRFRIIDCGYILPFYSTHISGGDTTKRNRKKQLNDLVEAVKKWWEPGDLPPIIVGDFNSQWKNENGNPDGWDTDEWQIMQKDFDEVGKAFGYDHIEHIWIGKANSFSGSIGQVDAVRYEYLSEFADHGTNLSDHGVTYAEVIVPGEDCIPFNPTNAQVVFVDRYGSWMIVDNQHSIEDFGNNKTEADKALAIIKHYGMNLQCSVARPNPVFKYYLVSGNPPSGSFPNEDCITFDPSALSVQKEVHWWGINCKIVENGHSLLDFGQKEGAAWRALELIKKYNFTHHCFVSHPSSNFEYWRCD